MYGEHWAVTHITDTQPAQLDSRRMNFITTGTKKERWGEKFVYSKNLYSLLLQKQNANFSKKMA